MKVYSTSVIYKMRK